MTVAVCLFVSVVCCYLFLLVVYNAINLFISNNDLLLNVEKMKIVEDTQTDGHAATDVGSQMEKEESEFERQINKHIFVLKLDA